MTVNIPVRFLQVVGDFDIRVRHWGFKVFSFLGKPYYLRQVQKSVRHCSPWMVGQRNTTNNRFCRVDRAKVHTVGRQL